MKLNGTALRVVTRVAAFCFMMTLPSMSHAQASIAGQVRDSSGAVLPGVTVEAASPALIEKTRSVTTDAAGQFRIVDLRPGTYGVTFTLAGFTTVKREGIELAGSFSAPLDVELKVGSVTETMTVSGESPLVDVQNVIQQRVLDHEVIDAIPTGKYHYNLAVLTPGVVLDAANGRLSQDVGGSVGDIQNRVSIHGGRPTDMRVTMDGLAMSSGDGAGEVSGLVPNMASTQEVALNLSAGIGRADRRRRPVQPDPARGWESLQRHVVRHRRQFVVSRQQHHRRTGSARPDWALLYQVELRRESWLRRSHPEGQVVVLRGRPLERRTQLRRQRATTTPIPAIRGRGLTSRIATTPGLATRTGAHSTAG